MSESSQPTDIQHLRFCLRCQAPLPPAGLERCPDCKLAFDPANPATYRTTQQRVRWRFWLPGLVLSIVCGVAAYGICLLNSSDLGVGLFLAVPVSFGAILGYATRARYWVLVLLGIICTAGVVFAVIAMNLAGYSCGATLGAIFIVPVLCGVIAGTGLRFILANSWWDQRWYLPLVPLIAFPYAYTAIENALRTGGEEAVITTELSVHATPTEAFDALLFYEEVEHAPPLLLQFSLPRPTGSTGDKRKVGGLIRCQYERGYLVKKITAVDPDGRLEFEVVEQHLHFERDVQLLGGKFEVIPDGRGRSKIQVSTRYRRKLYPRWIWVPIEEEVVHTLHEHVLEGIRRKAEEFEPEPEPPASTDPPGEQTPRDPLA